MEGREREEAEKRKPIGRDIRRYNCQYCGIVRSKKALINSHILSHHKEEIEREKENCEDNEKEETNSNTCEECGASFRKPAYLKQHMQSHSFENSKMRKGGIIILNGLVTGWGTSCEAPSSEPRSRAVHFNERPYACTVDDCHSSYKREDHLTRHLQQHQGKLFSCPVEGCNSRFAYQDNMKRHVTELHDETDSDSSDSSVPKQHVCPEVGCGKVFRFASRLRKHEESHGKPDPVEAICCEPGCWKSFANVECLKAHLQSSHLYINCEVCGTQQLKKNIKRHMRIHEARYTSHRIKCSFKGCLHTFSTKSNLNQHIKAVHLELRPFVCRFDGCGEGFPYKHVRDNHEKSGAHVYIQGDFEEADAQFRSRPRGGKKRKYPTVEMLLRKRVVPPGQADSTSCEGFDYLAWLLSASYEDVP